MPGLQYMRPVRAISEDQVAPGGSLAVLISGTSTEAALYADSALTVRLANPLRADAGGYLPAVYLSADERYDITIHDAEGGLVREEIDFLPLIAPLALDDSDPRDLGGDAMPLATLTFYLANTTELISLYSDEALTTPLENPVVADSSGAFPDIWFNPAQSVRVMLHDREGRLHFDVEQYRFRTEILPPEPPVLSGELDEENAEYDLSWTEAESPFGTIAGYKLYRSVDGGDFTLLVDQVPRTYDDATVEEGHGYSYYVVAYDSNGNESEPSNTVTITLNVLVEIIPASRQWVKPENLLSAEVEVIAAGGGGAGGGATCGTGFPVSAGAGGGGGYKKKTFTAAELPDTVDVEVGKGGLGGAGAVRVTAGTSAGAAGEDGGDTSFGTLLSANGGKGGRGGSFQPDPGSGGAGDTENGGNGGRGDISNLPGGDERAEPGDDTTFAGPGGGGGGPLKRFDVPGESGDGGSSADAAGGKGGVGQIGAGAVGEDGEDGEDNEDGAGGGGGGGGCAGSQAHAGSTATGGRGGDGGKYGAGGGGGGCAQSGGGAATGGRGGDGADGVVVLRYTYAT
jgi:hypothetical protein